MEDVCLNQQIFSEKFGRQGVVGVNASNLCSRYKNVFWTFFFKKFFGCLIIGEIQFFSSSSDQVFKSLRLQSS